MSETKSNKKLYILVAILLVLLAVAAIIFFIFKPKAVFGKKDITISIILSETEVKVYEISTKAEFLSEVLTETSLVPKEDIIAGFVTTIDGISADMAAEEWWMMTVNGEFSNFGINELPVIDGSSYEFTLCVGWDF